MTVNLTAYLLSACVLGFGLPSLSLGQQKQSFDLQQLLKENKLSPFSNQLRAINDAGKRALSCDGIIWLKDQDFSNGTIEIDLKGKDVFQRSFLGIAFHGVDTTTYDAVYLRPFNFRSTDSVRRIHAVQYISQPEYSWKRLREEHNGIYEKAILPPPGAEDWVHLKIVVDQSAVRVYIDHASSPSLQVNLLNARRGGLIGLWDDDLPGDFANLEITKN